MLLAKKYTVFQTKMAVAEVLGMSFGALVALVLAIFSVTSPLSVLLGLWHVAWCVAFALLGKKLLREAKDFRVQSNEDEEE